eukprot:8064434-Heterocapsa_arctica.AAC.1
MAATLAATIASPAQAAVGLAGTSTNSDLGKHDTDWIRNLMEDGIEHQPGPTSGTITDAMIHSRKWYTAARFPTLFCEHRLRANKLGGTLIASTTTAYRPQ